MHPRAPNFFLRGGWGASFFGFGVPKCIPYDSFMFPPSAQWFVFMFPMFPIAAHFILYVLAKFLFL
jgi:hypothetical protein